jgi:hypothetical protein
MLNVLTKLDATGHIIKMLLEMSRFHAQSSIVYIAVAYTLISL